MAVGRSPFPLPLVSGIYVPQSDLSQEGNGLFYNWENWQGIRHK